MATSTGTRAVLSSVPVEFRIISSKVNEVRTLGILCTSCFTLRSGFIAYGTISNLLGYSKDLPGVTPLILICGYYVLLETAPCILILYYTRRLPPPPPLQDNQIDAGPEHDYHPVSDGVGRNDGIYRSKKYNSGGGTKFGFDQDFPGQNDGRYQINDGR